MRVQTNLKILENLLPESYTTCRKQQVGNNSALNTFEALRLESMPYIYTASSERCITCRRTPGYSPPPKESTNLTHAAKMAAKKIVLCHRIKNPPPGKSIFMHSQFADSGTGHSITLFCLTQKKKRRTLLEGAKRMPVKMLLTSKIL